LAFVFGTSSVADDLTTLSPLQGSVRLSETLPPVPPQLRAGVVFNAGNLPANDTSTGWYRIPSWFAGTWHREFETDTLPNGKVQTQLSRVDVQHGHQVDRRKGIWHHHSEPFAQRIDAA